MANFQKNEQLQGLSLAMPTSAIKKKTTTIQSSSEMARISTDSENGQNEICFATCKKALLVEQLTEHLCLEWPLIPIECLYGRNGHLRHMWVTFSEPFSPC